MPSTKPIFTLRTDKENLDKLRIIAKIENRSDNKQLKKVLLDFIREYKSRNGKIDIKED